MRILVTRPVLQAREWVESLRAAGLQAEALPLIGIEPPADAAAVRESWSALAAQSLVVFVSPNAVTQFFGLRPSTVFWPKGVVAASPGPGTTLTLLHHGVPRAQIVEPAADAAQFDSESLWQVLQTQEWAARQVLVVRGTSGRDWLAERLRERGATLSFVAAYQRSAPRLSLAEEGLLDVALARPDEHLWFFSSSEAVTHLKALVPRADWSRSVALATHPRIAESAERLGLGKVHQARPSLAAVVACIQSIAS